ncbi:MAG: hypothetical protein JNJ57_15550 [Saprospiraceae bacterium]|nr:hypothetical protein [Saprospiraceae bacterium]
MCKHLLSLFLLLCSCVLTAQNQVLVQVTITPPYSHRLADYEQYNAQVLISLTNLTQQDLQMKIVGEIKGLNTGLFIKTRPEYIPNQIITLAPGEMRSYFGNQTTGYFDNNNTIRNIPGDLEADIIRTGLLPQDNYDYCIEVVDINTLQVLGRKCTLLPIQYLSPPQPNLPWCGESHNISIQSAINFSWLPPAGGMGQANLQYDFYLIPVPAGQDPGQLLQLAMDGQLPGQYFLMQNLAVNNYLYNPPNDPDLHAGVYVWGIVARDLNGLVGIENNGRSAFCTLTIVEGGANNGGNQQVGNFPYECGCKSPFPGGSNSPQLLTVGAIIKVGQYEMKILSTDGNGSGTGRILVPGFPGGIELPILTDFSGVQVNASREMIKGNVRAQRQPEVSFIPDVQNPAIQTLPLNASQIDQLDQYFEQNVEQLVSQMENAVESSGFKLPIGLDKNIGAQQIVVAITDMQFDATRAALDAAVVINLADAGTKIALSGRGICLQNGLDLCGEGELYLAENLAVPPIHMALRGLANTNDPKKATRVVFDRDGFKKLYVEAVYYFPKSLLTRLQGAEEVEASLSAETNKGWSDWVATVRIDPFRITGVNDFAFISTTAYYDHSTLTNPPGIPVDYEEGQPLTWTGFFMEKLKVELPPILKRRGDNTPLSVSADNVIIDSYGVTGSIGVNDILKAGEGGDGHWQFSVDRLFVRFLKNAFHSGGFNGKLILPITSRNEQSSLLYTSVLSYANSGFSYQFIVEPEKEIEVDLFAAYFKLARNSNIQISAGGGRGFEASAVLSGEFRIGGRFDSQLPRIDIAHVTFQNLGLTTVHPYYTPGKFQGGLGSPQKSVGGFPLNVTGWELLRGDIGLQATIDLQLSDLVGFLPNAEATIKFKGKFNQDYSPAFVKFEMSKIHLDANFSILHVDGDLEFYSKDAIWGDGFSGKVTAVFPPGFTVESRIQIGDKDDVNYWYVDGQLGKKSSFVPGLNAYGFSGGACYNMEVRNFIDKTDISVTENPDNYANLGGAPSGVQYSIKKGSSQMLAAAVLGFGTKELFNCNGKIQVTIKDGGLDKIAFTGAGRMFGEPGRTGIVNGQVFFEYEPARGRLDIAVGMKVSIAGVTADAFLSMHANKSTGDWNFKVGRPLGWGPPGGPCTFKFDFPPAPVKVDAGVYFQCGNFDVDGLPKRLPDLMQALFPEYPKGYVQQYSGNLGSGDGIAVGAYLQAELTLQYLIFYARFSAVFGFDIQIKKVTEGCDKYPVPGLNGWYGTGLFYAGIKAAIGIRIDLFFISGEFEILSISFGGILTGGGPNPTWVVGTVGGKFSILGGLVEGYCSFRFEAGDKCIPKSDPLAALKLISETYPANGNELQDITLDPSVSVNLAMDREFFLEEMSEKDGQPISIPRLFKFNKSDLEINLFNTKQPNSPLSGTYDFDPEGFGAAKIMGSMLEPNTDHILKVKATVQECHDIHKAALSPDGQHGHVLEFSACSQSGWAQARLKKNNQPYADERSIRFKTNQGLMRLNPDNVVYSLPHHNQRYFCYQDIAVQTFLGLRKRVLARDLVGNLDDPNAPKTLKVRLIPHNANQGIITEMSVPVNTEGISGGELGLYDAYGALYYWYADMWAHLRPKTTYGVQFFMEWELPQSQTPQNDKWMSTMVQERLLASATLFAGDTFRTNVVANERKINLEKYRLKKNQREVYRYYFRTSQYESIEEKLADLDNNQVVFSEFHSLDEPRDFSLAGADVSDWNAVVQALKAHFPEDLLKAHKQNDGSMASGISLRKLGLLGPERFDVFDIEGTKRTIHLNGQNGGYNQVYRIKPLLEFDRGAMKQYWDRVFNSAMDTLLRNGIFGNTEFVTPTLGVGWWVDDFKMKVFNIMGPIDTSRVLEDTQMLEFQSLPIDFGSFQMTYGGNSSIKQTSAPKLGYPKKPNLLEISRDFIKFGKPKSLQGAPSLGNLWLNEVKPNWNNIPGPAIPTKFFENIGAAFDVLNEARTPDIGIDSGGLGAGVKVNLLPNGTNQPVLQLGRRR